MKAVIQQPLIKRFIVWAFGCSWLIIGSLIIAANQGHLTQWGWLHYLVPWGVGSVGIWLSAQISSIRHLLSQLRPTRQTWPWLILAVALPTGLFAIASVLQWQINQTWPDWQQLGQLEYLGNFGWLGAWLVWLLSYGLAEELGWRGVLLPLLRCYYAPLAATCILAGIWFCWHIPFWFYNATYIQMGLIGLPMLAISLLASAFVFTWLYETGGLLSAVLFHTTFDYFSASGASNGLINSLMSSVIWVLACMIAWYYWRSKPAVIA